MIYKNKKVFILLLIIIAAVIVMSIVSPRIFLSYGNFQSMAVQIPEFGLLALGVGICMITGGIDLSVVSIANLSSIVAAMILVKFAGEASNAGPFQTIVVIILAILASIVIGAICGLFNGFLITRIGISPILATLGTMGLFGGLGVIITKGKGIFGFPEPFLHIGTGFLFKVPIVMYIFIGVALLLGLILNKTLFGFNVYMIGSNEIAAKFAGINISTVLLRTYMTSGIMAGIAAILMISRVNSARSGYAATFLLPAVLVVVLGGVNYEGGSGNVTGIFLALVLIQIVQSSFNILGASSFFKNVVLGAMLLIVMVINYVSIRVAERIRIRRRRTAS